MPLSKLLSGQVIPDHFPLKLSGIDHRVAEGFPGFSGWFPEPDAGQRSGGRILNFSVCLFLKRREKDSVKLRKVLQRAIFHCV